MKKILLTLTLIAVVATLYSFMSPLRSSHWAADPQQNSVEPDSVFVRVAASSSMLEVELGNMAMQKSTNQRVKDFANKMVQEHTRANQELTSLASTKNFTLPTAILPQHSKQVDKLMNLTGTEFDRMYMDIMVEEHKEDVDEFEDASKKATDMDVRAWAAKMLPHLQMHLDTARALHRYVRNNYTDTGDTTTTGMDTTTRRDTTTTMDMNNASTVNRTDSTAMRNNATMNNSNATMNNNASKSNNNVSMNNANKSNSNATMNNNTKANNNSATMNNNAKTNNNSATNKNSGNKTNQKKGTKTNTKTNAKTDSTRRAGGNY